MVTPCEALTEQIGLPFSCSPANQYIRIQTPFLYPDGDIVDIFYREDGDGIILTDLGETLGWLRTQTITQQKSPRQCQLIADICLNHHIELYRGMLTIRVGQSEDLAGATMRLLKGILRVSEGGTKREVTYHD